MMHFHSTHHCPRTNLNVNTLAHIHLQQFGMRTAGRLWGANNVGNNVKVPLYYSDGNTANYSSIYL